MASSSSSAAAASSCSSSISSSSSLPHVAAVAASASSSPAVEMTEAKQLQLISLLNELVAAGRIPAAVRESLDAAAVLLHSPVESDFLTLDQLSLTAPEQQHGETLLYCFCLPGITVTDKTGAEFCLVKVGKCEAGIVKSNNHVYRYPAAAKLLSRFASHVTSWGTPFDEQLRLFCTQKDLSLPYGSGSTTTVDDIRRSAAVQQDEYPDFACIIEQADEKALKMALQKIETSPLHPYLPIMLDEKKKFAWTEVRVMKLCEFESLRTAFKSGCITLERFKRIAKSVPKLPCMVRYPCEVHIYGDDGDFVESLSMYDDYNVDSFELA